ncbi:MAG: glycosyltransferase [Planctomycetota bacterium]
MSAYPGLTVVVPAFDEERRLSPTLNHLLRYLGETLERFEIIVVDDGSTDRTFDVIADRARNDPRVRGVRHSVNRGKGAAVRSGVRAARMPWVLLVDADLGVPIEEFPALWAHAADAPIVIGSKRMPGTNSGQTSWRRLLGGLGQGLIRTFCVDGFYDTQCGFKLVRTDVARALFRHGRLEGFGYDFEFLWLAQRARVDVIEAAVHVRDDCDGTVQFSSYLRVLVELAHFQWGRLVGAYDAAPRRPPVKG